MATPKILIGSSFTVEMHEQLEALAFSEGVSIAECIRNLFSRRWAALATKDQLLSAWRARSAIKF